MAIFKDLLSERVAKSEAFNPHDFSRHHCHGRQLSMARAMMDARPFFAAPSLVKLSSKHHSVLFDLF